MKCTFWNFDLSRSEQEASRFRTEPHIVKSTDGNLFRNPGCIKTVLYSKLQSLLIENIIRLTLVENRRRVVQAVKYVIQRRAEQISGNLSTGRFKGDGDVYKRASLGKRAPSFPPKSNLKQRGVFATATLSKTALKACKNLCEKCLFVNQER